MLAFYLITILTALFYAGNVPVCVALTVTTRGGFQARLGVGVFRSARAVTFTLPAFRAPKAGGAFPKPPPGMFKIVKWFLKRIDMHRLDARASFGDACHTALIAGGAQAILSALGLPAHVTPDFSRTGFSVAALGIVSFKAGHSILAASACAAIYGMGRLKAWTSGPLKALCKQRWNPFGTWSTSTP